MRPIAARPAAAPPVVAALVAACLAGVLALAAGPAAAGGPSLFGVRGPGLPNGVADARARAMGCAGLALGDSLHGNIVNPAFSSEVAQVTFGIAVTPGMTWARDPGVHESWGDLALSAAWLYLPFRNHWVVSTGLRNERSTRGEIGWTESYGGSPVGRRFRREGDHVALPLALSWSDAARRVSVAPGVDFLIASLAEKLSWEFSGTGFPGTTVQTTEHLTGVAPVLSLGFRPGSGRTALGLVYRHGATLEGDRELKQEVGTSSTERSRIDYPRHVAGGLAWDTGRLLLAGDVTWEDWSGFGGSGVATSADSRTDDALSWGLGLEAGGAGRRIPVMGRRPLRLGFRHDELPEISYGDGSRVTQNVLSLGTGWALAGGIATLDLSLEAGTRGSLDHHDARERILQFGVSISGREPWKKPDRHGW